MCARPVAESVRFHLGSLPMKAYRNFLLGASLLLCVSAPAQEPKIPPYDPSGPGQVSVSTCSGKPCLKRDGIGPYRPKGLIIEGLSAARSSWPLLSPAYRDMGEKLSMNTLVALRQFGADSVRFNVSQVNLDVQTSFNDDSYADQIVLDVRAARALGMTVLLEVNDEQPPKSGRLGYPSDSTERFWKRMLPLIGNDQGIMLGAYNEPLLDENENDLSAWQAGYNRIVAAIRSAGAKNVIVVDAPYWGQHLTPAALNHLVTDSAHNLVYGVHPFPVGPMARPAEWPRLFQQFCTSSSVLCQITAWNMYDLVVNGFEIKACPNQSPEQFQRQMPVTAQRLLDVAKSMNSGIYGWAFDYPNIIMDSSAPLSKTVSFNNFIDCQHTPTPWGGGELLKRNFADPKW